MIFAMTISKALDGGFMGQSSWYGVILLWLWTGFHECIL
jgi:hypothetical protein